MGLDQRDGKRCWGLSNIALPTAAGAVIPTAGSPAGGQANTAATANGGLLSLTSPRGGAALQTRRSIHRTPWLLLLGGGEAGAACRGAVAITPPAPWGAL